MIYIIFQKNNDFSKKSKIFNALILIFIFFLINILFVFRDNDSDPNYSKIKKFENSYSKSFLEKFFGNSITEMKKFRELNYKNSLMDYNHFEKKENPDVSVIITAYNQAHCFYGALRSVQSQSLKNIEIIIIDDCSLDNTTEVVEAYMKEDNRIIYIKHESNDGKIKSRSDGVRIAKGKYITIIDGADALGNENILNNSFTIASLANLDVVEFAHAFFRRKNYKSLNLNYRNIKHLSKRIIYQPELSYKFVDLNEPDSNAGYANRIIWAKLIKKEIFKNVLVYIGQKYTEDYLLDYEDTIMTVSLFHIANSYYYMNECGYYVASGECENPFPLLKFKKCIVKNISINKALDSMKYLHFLLEKSKGKKIENDFIYKELIAIDYYKKLDKLINKNFSFVYFILDSIKKSNLNSEQRKSRISKIKEKLLKKENMIKLKKLPL